MKNLIRKLTKTPTVYFIPRIETATGKNCMYCIDEEQDIYAFIDGEGHFQIDFRLLQEMHKTNASRGRKRFFRQMVYRLLQVPTPWQ